MTAYAPLSAVHTGNALASGEGTCDRLILNSASQTTFTSQALRLTFWTARKTEKVTKVATFSGGTAAGATPTLCRVGIYTVAANGGITLAAAIANDTALWAATNTEYERALTTTLHKVRGQRYATGILCVSAATMPQLLGVSIGAGSFAALLAEAPRVAAVVGSQTDLPSSVAAGSLVNDGRFFYSEVRP